MGNHKISSSRQTHQRQTYQKNESPSPLFTDSDSDRIWTRNSPCEKAARVIYGVATVALGVLTFASAVYENISLVEFTYGRRLRGLHINQYSQLHNPFNTPEGYRHVIFPFTEINQKNLVFQYAFLVGSIAALYLANWKKNVSHEESKVSYHWWRAVTIIHGIAFGGISYAAKQSGYHITGPLGMALAGTELAYGAFETLSRRNKQK